MSNKNEISYSSNYDVSKELLETSHVSTARKDLQILFQDDSLKILIAIPSAELFDSIFCYFLLDVSKPSTVFLFINRDLLIKGCEFKQLQVDLFTTFAKALWYQTTEYSLDDFLNEESWFLQIKKSAIATLTPAQYELFNSFVKTVDFNCTLDVPSGRKRQTL